MTRLIMSNRNHHWVRLPPIKQVKNELTHNGYIKLEPSFVLVGQ